MSNPGLAAVQPGNPLTGVKRGLTGKPTGVPGGLPAFRGRNVEPGGKVKAPKIANGNRPNRGSNITIPYSRVTPLELLNQFCGRVSPGDLAFSSKTPIAFMNNQYNVPDCRAALGSSHANVTRTIGVDGMNKILYGGTATGGWVEGINAFRATPDDAWKVVRSGWRTDDVLANDPRVAGGQIVPSPDLDVDANAKADAFGVAALAAPYPHEPDLLRRGTFRLAALNEFALDGVIISNDEPETWSGSGARDATIFLMCIQGSTMVNNGFLAYDGNFDDALPKAPDLTNPGQPRAPRAQDRGNDVGNIMSGLNRRTVEAYARGSLENERHMSLPLSFAARNGGNPWLPDGVHDFVASFTGGYTQYPQQARRAARRAARSHPRPAAVQFLRTRPVRRCSTGTLSRPTTSTSGLCASRCRRPTGQR